MMRRKPLYYFTMVFALVLLTVSCSKSKEEPGASDPDGTENPGGPDDGTGSVDTETAMFSVRVRMGSDEGGSKGTDSGTDNEKLVLGIRVVLYDSEDLTVAYSWDLDATNVDENGEELTEFNGSDVAQDPDAALPTEERFVSVARNIKKADYKMLAIINPTDDIKRLTIVGRSWDELLEPVEKDYTEFFQYGYFSGKEVKNFMMLNNQGLVDVLAARDFYETPEKAQANPVRVSVERVLAKVIVSGSNISIPDGVNYRQPLWDLDVMNRRTYWLRKMTWKADGTMEAQGHADRVNFYAEDPNFEGYSVVNFDTEVERQDAEVELEKQFIYVDATRDFWNSFGFEAYALENTMRAEEQYRDVTTTAVIRIQYILDGLNWENAHFFVYNGYQIPYTDMEEYAAGNQTIPAELERLDYVIDRITGEYGYNFHRISTIEKSFSLYGLDFYKNGICYYRIPIRHFDDDQVPVKMGYGRYGIVRNNVYQINIRSISGPGKAVLERPGPDPDDEDGGIVYDVVVADWDRYELNFEF